MLTGDESCGCLTLDGHLDPTCGCYEEGMAQGKEAAGDGARSVESRDSPARVRLPTLLAVAELGGRSIRPGRG